ncbi:hypothetical protein AB2Z22_001289 [Clostridium botulinum]
MNKGLGLYEIGTNGQERNYLKIYMVRVFLEKIRRILICLRNNKFSCNSRSGLKSKNGV